MRCSNWIHFLLHPLGFKTFDFTFFNLGFLSEYPTLAMREDYQIRDTEMHFFFTQKAVGSQMYFRDECVTNIAVQNDTSPCFPALV